MGGGRGSRRVSWAVLESGREGVVGVQSVEAGALASMVFHRSAPM